MTSKRLFYLLVALLGVLAIATFASVTFGSSLLQKQADDLMGLKVKSKQLDQQQISLTQAKKDIETYSELESIAKTVVPQEKDQARTVREIINIANQLGIKIANISFPTSDLGQPKSGQNTQIVPVEGITGLYQMDVTVQSDSGSPVSYDSFLDFLKRLEQNRRTAQVTNLSVQPTAENRNFVTFDLVLRVYIKPQAGS